MECSYVSCGTSYNPKQIAISPVCIRMSDIQLTLIPYVRNTYPHPNGYNKAGKNWKKLKIKTESHCDASQIWKQSDCFLEKG